MGPGRRVSHLGPITPRPAPPHQPTKGLRGATAGRTLYMHTHKGFDMKQYFMLFWPAASATGEDIPPYTYRFGGDHALALGNYAHVLGVLDHGEQGVQLWVAENGVDRLLLEAGNV